MDESEGPAGRADDEGDILANNPRAINVAEFAIARAAELKTMTEAIMTMGGMRRTFQKLPRHLRRRAMSHDLRRLPKRLRDSEERAMHKSISKKRSGPGKEGSGGDEDLPPAKRSRRHRRRPGNLKQEYQRRQGGHAWLETHIWHAKRFKMTELWGYRLPLHPSDKSVRATYRAMARHCLLQDVSYLRVIEMVGPKGMIVRALSHLTSPAAGLTCAAVAFLTGQRHGEAMFYENDRFPEGAIGPVNFLWRAETTRETSQEGEEKERPSASTGAKFEDSSAGQLWLWSHPSCCAALLKEVRAASEAENSKTVLEGSIAVRQLEDCPLRFRLQGPLSHHVLLDTLKVADVSDNSGLEQPKMWWEDYYANPDRGQVQAEQLSIWDVLHGVQTATVLPPRCVLSLTVRDPRNLLPVKKLKIMPDPDEFVGTDHLPAKVMQSFPESVSVSPIWEQSVRQSVTSTQIPIHKLNKMRSELLVPGQELGLGRRESRVPVLLLQQPGVTEPNVGAATASRKSKQQSVAGFGSGWDIVLPSGWGMAFWIALIFRGARAAGLRESRSCRLQQGLPHFPEGYPDTAAGEGLADKVDQELTKKFKKWPPAKRPNYGKLGVISPFRCPWKKLLEEWQDAEKQEMDDEDGDAADSSKDRTSQASDLSTPSQEESLHAREANKKNQTFFVLRERSRLEKLSEALSASHRPPRVVKPAKGINQIGLRGEVVGSSLKSAKTGVEMEASNGHDANEKLNSQSKESQTGHRQRVRDLPDEIGEKAERVLVAVKLCMVNRGVPHPFAMICLPNDKDVSSFKSDKRYCPVEPIHREFKLPQTSKKKKRKGKKDKNPRELREDAGGGKCKVAPSRRLFDSCARRVIGFVTDGANAFVSGRGQAVGYCCMLGLQRLVEERPQGQTPLVLVRDTKTVQYRFAFVDVII